MSISASFRTRRRQLPEIIRLRHEIHDHARPIGAALPLAPLEVGERFPDGPDVHSPQPLHGLGLHAIDGERQLVVAVLHQPVDLLLPHQHAVGNAVHHALVVLQPLHQALQLAVQEHLAVAERVHPRGGGEELVEGLDDSVLQVAGRDARRIRRVGGMAAFSAAQIAAGGDLEVQQQGPAGSVRRGLPDGGGWPDSFLGPAQVRLFFREITAHSSTVAQALPPV